MKDQAIQVVQHEETDQTKRNRLREYIQHVLLRELFEHDLLDDLVFHGGTALRIIHDLARFSEDLDFHLTHADPDYDLGAQLENLKKGLEYQGYQIELRPRLQGNVQSCSIQFERLLYECGLTPHEGQKLNVKFEIDTNPPAGFDMERSPVDQYFPFVVLHHDKPSFMAGKLHAILQRDYAKGRDYYDLMFFLNRWKGITPHIPYLNNALKQTGYRRKSISERSWRTVTASKVKSVDWTQVEKDIDPFLLRRADLKAFKKEFLLKLLEQD